MVAWLFPGQGSQRRGMGTELLQRHPDTVAIADAELGYSVAEMCLDDPNGLLRDTRYAQPALFVVEALGWLTRSAAEPAPDYLAGHSLGEYAALFASGCFDFATGVRLVRRRGELMSRARDGGMLAVLGRDAGRVDRLLAAEGYADLDIANVNAADQVVLAGPSATLSRAARTLTGHGFRCVPLAVSAAFHSRYMADAAADFAADLARVPFTDPAVPVISNVTGQPYGPGAVADLLARQIAHPVRWAQSMRYLLDQGVSRVVEIGPGTTLAGLWRTAVRHHGERPAERREPANSRTARASGATALGPAPAIPFSAPTGLAVETPPPVPPASLAAALVRKAPVAKARPEGDPVVADRGPTAESLGSADFRRDYGIRCAYLSGSMYHGIASVDLVVRMSRAGLMGFFGAGGLRPDRVQDELARIHRALGGGGRYGMNLLCTLGDPGLERAVAELYVAQGVRYVEAAAYPMITAPLVHYRFAGAYRRSDGRPVAVNRVLAKVSRPEVAEAFLRPPPRALLDILTGDGRLTAAEADAATGLPVAEDICVEADSGGHTDAGVALTLLPTIQRLRDTVCRGHGYPRPVRVGAAGGLGAPEALAAVFVMGADFVVTGSVNQCTPEAGTSEEVKNLLATVGVQDTGYAPAGDLFEAGARVQVVRKGSLFAPRANRIHQVYRRYGALEEMDAASRIAIERDCFGGLTFDEVWERTRVYLAEHRPEELAGALRDPRRRMALVLRRYFRLSTALALAGDPEGRANYQIHCGPAMGAFNAWVSGTELEDWRHRHVDVIADRLMTATAEYLRTVLHSLASAPVLRGDRPEPLNRE